MRWRKDRIAEIVGGIMHGYGLNPVRIVRCPLCNREDIFIPELIVNALRPNYQGNPVGQSHWDCLGCHARVAVFCLEGRFILKLHREWP